MLQCAALNTVAAHLLTTASVRLRDDSADWNRVAEAMRVDAPSIRLIHQVHGHGVGVVRRGDPSPAGRSEADIIIVGPCLGPCCGEMGPEVVEAFRRAGYEADIDRWFTPGASGRPRFNLWLANRDQLERAGVPPDAIDVSSLCTKCRPDVFHSYRAAGAGAGRMVGVIRAAVAHERKSGGACHDVHQAPRKRPD